MTRYEYDEDASARMHMDVVYEVDDEPLPVSRWLEAMRRLNGITDPLARQILRLHQDCGSGGGVCDTFEDEAVPIANRREWGCETTQLIADHFGVHYPTTPRRDDD